MLQSFPSSPRAGFHRGGIEDSQEGLGTCQESKETGKEEKAGSERKQKKREKTAAESEEREQTASVASVTCVARD